jgi:hypothetical protein
VTTGSSGSLWSRFEHDPRDPAYAGMRASDRDRAVVHDALGEAYADGRLDRDELDERTTQVNSAKTYADLVPPLQDLLADFATSTALAPASSADLERLARLHYSSQLREALFGFLVPNLICWAIWFMTGHGWPWPIFVSIPTGLNVVRVATSRGEIIQKRIEKLQRREAKELETPTPEA